MLGNYFFKDFLQNRQIRHWSVVFQRLLIPICFLYQQSNIGFFETEWTQPMLSTYFARYVGSRSRSQDGETSWSYHLPHPEWRVHVVLDGVLQMQYHHPSQQFHSWMSCQYPWHLSFQQTFSYWPSCHQKNKDGWFLLCITSDSLWSLTSISHCSHLGLFYLCGSSFLSLSVDDQPHITDPCMADDGWLAWFVTSHSVLDSRL